MEHTAAILALDDTLTSDYDCFVDNLAGRDWKIFFWLDKELGKWIGPTYYSSANDGESPYDTEEIETNVPNAVRQFADEQLKQVREVYERTRTKG